MKKGYYGQGANPYQNVTEQVKQDSKKKRSFTGLTFDQVGTLNVPYVVKNTHATDKKRVAIFAGALRNMTQDALNKVLGESIDAVVGGFADENIVVSNEERLIAAGDFFNYVPTRIRRIDATCNQAKAGVQFLNNLKVGNYHPAKNLGSEEYSFEQEIRATNYRDNKVSLNTETQLDSETYYIVDIEAGAELSLTMFLGATINIPYSLNADYLAQKEA
ncbi:MAG: hypothetical protein LBN95_13005 [Prevotellaceae bacterium]|jgi:hypothetical protein|nr:hypothetical protein [Prevotellaceae bacterium]